MNNDTLNRSATFILLFVIFNILQINLLKGQEKYNLYKFDAVFIDKESRKMIDDTVNLAIDEGLFLSQTFNNQNKKHTYYFLSADFSDSMAYVFFSDDYYPLFKESSNLSFNSDRYYDFDTIELDSRFPFPDKMSVSISGNIKFKNDQNDLEKPIIVLGNSESIKAISKFSQNIQLPNGMETIKTCVYSPISFPKFSTITIEQEKLKLGTIKLNNPKKMDLILYLRLVNKINKSVLKNTPGFFNENQFTTDNFGLFSTSAEYSYPGGVFKINLEIPDFETLEIGLGLGQLKSINDIQLTPTEKHINLIVVDSNKLICNDAITVGTCDNTLRTITPSEQSYTLKERVSEADTVFVHLPYYFQSQNSFFIYIKDTINYRIKAERKKYKFKFYIESLNHSIINIQNTPKCFLSSDFSNIELSNDQISGNEINGSFVLSSNSSLNIILDEDGYKRELKTHQLHNIANNVIIDTIQLEPNVQDGIVDLSSLPYNTKIRCFYSNWPETPDQYPAYIQEGNYTVLITNPNYEDTYLPIVVKRDRVFNIKEYLNYESKLKKGSLEISLINSEFKNDIGIKIFKTSRSSNNNVKRNLILEDTILYPNASYTAKNIPYGEILINLISENCKEIEYTCTLNEESLDLPKFTIEIKRVSKNILIKNPQGNKIKVSAVFINQEYNTTELYSEFELNRPKRIFLPIGRTKVKIVPLFSSKETALTEMIINVDDKYDSTITIPTEKFRRPSKYKTDQLIVNNLEDIYPFLYVRDSARPNLFLSAGLHFFNKIDTSRTIDNGKLGDFAFILSSNSGAVFRFNIRSLTTGNLIDYSAGIKWFIKTKKDGKTLVYPFFQYQLNDQQTNYTRKGPTILVGGGVLFQLCKSESNDVEMNTLIEGGTRTNILYSQDTLINKTSFQYLRISLALRKNINNLKSSIDLILTNNGLLGNHKKFEKITYLASLTGYLNYQNIVSLYISSNLSTAGKSKDHTQTPIAYREANFQLGLVFNINPIKNQRLKPIDHLKFHEFIE